MTTRTMNDEAMSAEVKTPERIKVWAVFDPSAQERRTDAELEAEALKKARRIDGRVLRLVELRLGEVVVDVEALVKEFELIDAEKSDLFGDPSETLRTALKKVGVR